MALQKSAGARTQPCLTPEVVVSTSESEPLTLTLAVVPEYLAGNLGYQCPAVHSTVLDDPQSIEWYIENVVS